MLAGCAAPVATRSPAPNTPERRLAEALSGMIWPLPLTQDRAISSRYGVRGVRHHDGLDIRAGSGDPIHAARDGVVVFSGWMRGYGYLVILDHGHGVTTRYGHASELLVAVGRRVARGEPIARVGATGNATGNHLHFEVRWAGRPLDPTPLMPRFTAAR
jgi:murein DD-endopeptidase MepM/ murein hydrolase activator NlpD